MRLPDSKNSDPERPIEINRFQMLVPQHGYCWLDDAYPSQAWGEENRRALMSGPPYMVMKGPSTLSRVYHPFIGTPDLFLRFKNLNIDHDSILKFANQYGWIGERGVVEYGGAQSIRAVGLSTWIDQIDKMKIAYRLLDLVRIKDQQALSRYFFWHPKRFDVQVRITMKGETMCSYIPGSDTERGHLCGWLVGGHIMPSEVPDLPKLGWERNDFTRPALVIAASIINKEIGQSCRPMLTMDDKNACLRGYWTAENLIGCMWLQFYLSVIGQLKLRRCTECGLEMNVTNSRTNKRVHDRCSKTKRQARWRANSKLSEE
jgi:hypothetical protein